MSQQSARILVVDDNRVNRLLLARTLEQQGHHVDYAENGRRAMTMLHDQAFDLVLLDVLMPEMDGYEVLGQVSADPLLRDTPVIMISALDEIDAVARCIEMGAEDYLPKPFNATLLQARINSSLEKKRLRDRQRDLFGKFVSDQVAEQLMQSDFALGGKLADATAMFCDIRSFTSICESQSPAATIALLNSYFNHMFGVVEEQGGIVTQIVGDGFLAIFGAPVPHEDHRERAVIAALKMLDRRDQFNREQAASGLAQITIGVGIASGEMVVGFTGTERRAIYTCLGDAVNLAARLESHTKHLGEPILIDENTKAGLAPDLRVTDCGIAQIRGKSLPVHIYSVVPLERYTDQLVATAPSVKSTSYHGENVQAS